MKKIEGFILVIAFYNKPGQNIPEISKYFRKCLTCLSGFAFQIDILRLQLSQNYQISDQRKGKWIRFTELTRIL